MSELTSLQELRASLDAARMDMQARLNEVLTREQRQQIANIQSEFLPRIREIEIQIKERKQGARDAELEA